MAKKIIGIYQITCTVNNRRYIGQSIDIKRRFNQHKRKPPDGMIDDVAKYGIDKFKFEILEECAPEELTAREDFYLSTLNPEYNIRTEGHGISEEARKKLHESKLGKKHPDISRRVKCVETGEVFESLRAAAKWCNVPPPNLSALLAGKGRTLGGYHWIFADEDEEAALERIRQMPEGRQRTDESKARQRRIMTGRKLSPEHCDKIRQAHLGKSWKESTYEKCCRKIRCVETDEIFPSIKEAAEHYNLKRPNISAALSGKAKSCGGYHWEYVDGQSPKKRSENFRRKVSKPVRCVETGVVYESVAKAAEAFGVTDSAIGNAASGKREKSCGYHWEFFDGELAPLEETQTVAPMLILCVETQEIFQTVHDAAEKFGISAAAISHALNGRAKSTGGHQWKFRAKLTA